MIVFLSLLFFELFLMVFDMCVFMLYICFYGLGKCYFGGVQVLWEIDLEICCGEVFGIIGCSGVGKFLLICIFNCLECFSEGQVLIDDEDIGGYDGQCLVVLC